MTKRVSASEFNFDGLIGPTHNFAGLALGNLPSAENRFSVSHPKQAALEGLRKMKLLLDLGVKQAVIPPQERPSIEALRKRGYAGSEKEILEKVGRENPQTLLECSSSSFMWTANAATTSPSSDTGDGRVHITPANLLAFPHRALESEQTAKILNLIFKDERRFVNHPPLLNEKLYFDEGAANQMRLAPRHGQSGIEIFVYGKDAKHSSREPKRYPARQSLEASQAIAQSHQLQARRTVVAKQNPAAIDLGVFHNDLIATSNEGVFIVHELAFEQTDSVLGEIRKKFKEVSSQDLWCLKISEQTLGLEKALRSFFFNSQIVSLPDGSMTLIAPETCRHGAAKNVIDQIVKEANPIRDVCFVHLQESMSNGGGPACLRLRVVLSEQEAASIHEGFVLTEERYHLLVKWVNQHYRDKLHLRDLSSPRLLSESRDALDALTQLLAVGPLYAFQK